MKKKLLLIVMVLALLCNFAMPVMAQDNINASEYLFRDNCYNISDVGWTKNQQNSEESFISENGKNEYMVQGLKGNTYSNICKYAKIGNIPWNLNLGLKIQDIQKPKANNQWRGFTVQIVYNRKMVRMSLNSLQGGTVKAYILSSSAKSGYIEKDIQVPQDGEYHHWNIFNDGNSNIFLTIDGNKVGEFNNVNYYAKNVDDSILIGNDMHDNGSGKNSLFINSIELSKAAFFTNVQLQPVSDKGTVTILSSYKNNSYSKNVKVSGLLYNKNMLISQKSIYVNKSNNFSLDFTNVNNYGDLKLVLNLYIDGHIADTVEKIISVSNNEIVKVGDTINAANVGTGIPKTYIFYDWQRTANSDTSWHSSTYDLLNTGKTLNSIVYRGSSQAGINIPVRLNGDFAIFIGYSTATKRIAIKKGDEIKDVDFKSVIGGNQTCYDGTSKLKESFLLGSNFNNESFTIIPKDYNTEIFYIKIRELTDSEKQLFSTKDSGGRIMFDDDGFSNFYSNEYNNADALKNKSIETALKGNIGDINWCLGTTGMLNYNSQYAGNAYNEIEKYKQQIRPGDITALTNIKNIIDTTGKSPIELIAEAGDKNGIRVNASLRMDDFFNPNELGILNGPMYDEYKDCLQSDHMFLSYAYPKFRKYIINVLKEVASFKGVDGVTLDYCRNPNVIGNEATRSEKIDIMNQFMRDVKKALPATTKINVRIPCDSAIDYGLDAATWVKEGIIDVLIPSATSYEKYFDITPFVNMVKGSKVKVYDGITADILNYVPTDEEKKLEDQGVFKPKSYQLVYQQYLLRAADAYSKGADGIFLFNTSRYDINNNFQIISNKVNTLLWKQFQYQNELISYAINKVVEDGYKVLPDKTSVPKNKVWTIKFNSSLKTETVNKNNIFVKDINGNNVDIKVTYEPKSNSIVILPPDGNYTTRMTYSMYISNNVTSEKGKGLSQPVKMSFVVAP